MTSLEGFHAWIIEDEETSIDVLDNLLRQLAVTTTVIESNPHIIDDLRETPPPDVIFLDLEMPNLNGYEILSLLREDADFDHVPIVAYTTHISHMSSARDAGFDSFLGKPIHRGHFADNLTKILSGEAVWEAP
jgi:CheY-like chemotaxis protein